LKGGEIRGVNKRVRLEDIARVLQISRGTVDRALHNRPGVNPEVRDKVLKKAAEMGYRTNRAARSLVKKQTLTIGVVIPSEPRSYWGGVEEGFRSASSEFQDFGIQCVFFSSPIRSLEQDTMLIQQALRSGVDGLAIAPFNTVDMRNLIDEIVDSNIPVVTYVTDVPESKRLCYVGNEPLKEGRVAGEIFGKLLRGQGESIVFRGREGLYSNSRLDGFYDVLKTDFPNVVVHTEEELYMSSNIVHEKVNNLLDLYPNLDGIFVANSFTDSVASVLVQRGLAKKICLVGFDLTKETELYLKKGVVDAVVTSNSFRQGYEAFKILADYLLEGKRPVGNVSGSVEVVFREML